MLIHYEHVHHYNSMTNTIYQLRLESQYNIYDTKTSTTSTGTSSSISRRNNIERVKENFYGTMSEQQLARTIPGFIRVEVVNVSDEELDHHRQQIMKLKQLQQKQLKMHKNMNHPFFISNIPTDYVWDIASNISTTISSSIDPSICCYVTNFTSQQRLSSSLPMKPTIHQIYFWEMNINALGVRHMPNLLSSDYEQEGIMTELLPSLDWVMLLGGNNNEMFLSNPEYIIGDYWSGNDQYHNNGAKLNNNNANTKQEHGEEYVRPDRRKGSLLNNQGGWMGTRRQIIEWHIRWCRGSFLPYV
jgi:hypothetical protein